MKYPTVDEQQFQTVPEDDPDRCHGFDIQKSEQCRNKKLAGNFCGRHQGKWIQRVEELKKCSDYRLQVWQQRVDEFAESKQAKSLKGEIGILRLTLESILTKCQDQTDIILYASKIGDMVSRIERVVISCDRLETKMGMTLDKAAALSFASQIINVVSQHVQDPIVIDKISNGIIDSLK